MVRNNPPVPHGINDKLTPHYVGTNITKRMNSKIGYILVVMGLAACANDDFVDVDPTSNNGGAIGFGSNIEAVTRAASGKDAADKLGSTFYVFGIKNETENVGKLTAQNLVFDNYKVTFKDGTANTATSNTSGWDYAGLQLSDKEKANITKDVTITPTTSNSYQTVKYWDANATDYTYYAFSAKSDDIGGDKVKVKKNTDNTGLAYDNGYTVELTAEADPASLYFSNRQYIKQSTITSTASENTYGGEVQFTFRNAMAKVRVGMYETIPGYSVTIDGFEVAESSATPSFGDMTTAVIDKFAANLASNKKGTAGTMKVTYRSNDYTDENRPVVAFGEVDNNDFKEKKDAVLYLGTNLINKELKTSTAELVYDDVDDDGNSKYTDVYPMESNEHNLKLKVDFTLKSTVGETITVKGATAEVPAQYLQWKPGCAYTYIFKISDQTNGILGSLTGLHPITFEAVNIVDGTGEDELISTTTASNYNIITFGCDDQHMVTVGQDDYNEGDDIYAVVVKGENSNGTTTVTDVTGDNTDKATKLYEVTTNDDQSYPITEASVENYLNKYASDNNLLDAPVTAILVADDAEDKASYVTEVPKGDETSSTNSLNAMKWKAKKTVYAVEYTVPSTSTTSSGTKYYKVVRVDGFTGKIEGELTLSNAEVENAGDTLTATLKINNEAITSGVTYALEDQTVTGISIDNNGTVTVQSNTTAGTYTVKATYNRRTYKATFTVNQ